MSKRKTKKPFQKFQIIAFNWDEMPPQFADKYPPEFGRPADNKWAVENRLIWLGELPQMPEHCIVATHNGKILWGYHTENFIAVPEDEI